jgi:hypothetical protein
MNDFIAILGCLAAIGVSICVLRRTPPVRRFRVYESGGVASLSVGKVYEVRLVDFRQLGRQMLLSQVEFGYEDEDVTKRRVVFARFVENESKHGVLSFYGSATKVMAYV